MRLLIELVHQDRLCGVAHRFRLNGSARTIDDRLRGPLQKTGTGGRLGGILVSAIDQLRRAHA